MLRSPDASVAVEPLVMQLLVTLSRRAGQLVTRRELFDVCWGNAPVGDDSLNRIVAVLRKALQRVGRDAIRIETVPSTGYILRFNSASTAVPSSCGEVQRAIDAAIDSWRLGLPEPDHLRIEQLRRACALNPANARTWGVLALLCRHAAEYGGPTVAPAYVRECEGAARRATELDPAQPEALTALASIVPLFGQWTDSRRRLFAILDRNPDCAVATQDLATLEMATGRVRESKRLRESLIARDPLAACYCYKSVYQHWSVGDLTGMDHAANRAIQLWPTHPAVWMVRLWTLAFTSRVPAALSMLDDAVVRPQMPHPIVAFLRQVLSAAVEGKEAAVVDVIDASTSLASTGPANAIAAMFALSLLDRAERTFEIAEAYYLRAGKAPVPIHHTQAEISINEHHRRLTQVLFTPVFAPVRGDPRFMALCDRIGLARYWEENSLTPDFLT
ncbi:MAG: winged helix-turn-helix domain-containing protein [Sphingomicrobium sp.]|nr:winged helix-turn-helix domain-containing protein [Sphingomonadales bacterium]